MKVYDLIPLEIPGPQLSVSSFAPEQKKNYDAKQNLSFEVKAVCRVATREPFVRFHNIMRDAQVHRRLDSGALFKPR